MRALLLSAMMFLAPFGVVLAQHHGHAPSAASPQPSVTHAGPPVDTRMFVAIPEPMNTHMLANMRDHLLALEEIQAALGRGELILAGKISEQRIGMSSLQSHGASHVAQFMPQGMQDAGTGMHRAASRFAIIAADAEIKGDLKPVLAALSEVTRHCVGCHAGYRTK